ncbi:MAG: DUF2946 family protein [Burkholderiaceae bacterium]
MDENVLAAMARWPNVPDVFGWLSLTESGQWRLYPRGDALDPDPGPGEAISSPPILRFIGRNYAADAAGQWFFQNGPQRVYVRLDAAPYVLHTEDDAEGRTRLLTHTGLPVNTPEGWWLGDDGRLYAQTEHGAALVAGRDLECVLSLLRAPDGKTALEQLEVASGDAFPVEWPGPAPTSAQLRFCPASALASTLGFVARPQAAR